MNRTIIASLILVLCIVLGIASLVYIENICADMIETTDRTIDSILSENEAALAENVRLSIEKLEKHRPILNLIMGQDDTIELRGNLNQAIFYCNCKDYQAAILHLQEYKTDLNRIISSNEPTPSTIF